MHRTLEQLDDGRASASPERGHAARDGAGWHTCLDGLEAALVGAENPREAMSAWHEVHPHYLESFGPEAATIGPPEGIE